MTHATETNIAPMLVPTASDELRSIAGELESVILPALQGQVERSTVATMLHLLRHAGLRLSLEGQLLFDEIVYLRPLLARAAEWLGPQDALGARAGAAATAQSWSPAAAPFEYPSLDRVARRVAELRQIVDELLVVLHARAPDDPQADGLHAAVRTYIGWQIEQEGKLVEPAFRGWGPRR